MVHTPTVSAFRSENHANIFWVQGQSDLHMEFQKSLYIETLLKRKKNLWMKHTFTYVINNLYQDMQIMRLI